MLMHAAFARMRLAWTPTSLLQNATIEHMIGLARAFLYAVFKVCPRPSLLISYKSVALLSPHMLCCGQALLARQLEAQLTPNSSMSTTSPLLSWWIIFSPSYLAALLQIVLHLHKLPEPSPTNRRSER